MADNKLPLRADEDPMVNAYRSPTSAAAEARGKGSGAAAIEQAVFDKGQSTGNAVPAPDDDEPGPLATGPKSPLQPFGGSPATDTRQRLAALDTQSMKMNPPTYAPIPPPVPKTSNPMDVWGSMAMVLAAFGSMKTRQPLTTAMNAAAGVIKGFHDGNKEASDAEFKTWEAANKNAMDNAKFQMDVYKTAIDQYERKAGRELQMGTMEEAEAARELTILAKASGDPMLAQVLAERGVPGVKELVQKQRDAIEKIEKSSTAMVDQYGALTEFGKYKKEQEALPPEQRDDPDTAREKIAAIAKKNNLLAHMTPQQKVAFETAELKAEAAQKRRLELKNATAANVLDDASALLLAQRVLAGDKSATQGLGVGPTGQANRAKIQKMIQQEAASRGMTAEDIAIKMQEFMGLGAAERVTGGRSANIQMAANEANNMMSVAAKASEELPRVDFVPINKLMQMGEGSISDPRLARLKTAINGLSNAYARAINPSGVATVYSKQKADEILSSATSHETFMAVMDIMKKEMDAALKSPGDTQEQLRRQYGGTGGGKPGEAAAPKPVSGSPPVSALQEGHETEFGNGSVWTLKDGKPVQVR